VRDLELGRLIRALRRRRRWRQEDCAVRAGVHRSTWSLLERGHLDGMPLRTLRRCLAALEVRLDLVPRWRGADLNRLLDERHAALGVGWTTRLRAWRWQVQPEASFSRYGERGRIDLLAWHGETRTLLVVELKTEVVDVQELLGVLDVKVRLAPIVARQLGWGTAASVVPAIVISDTSTNRRRLQSIDPLFARYALRGRPALSWLRRPVGAPSGLLIFSVLSSAPTSRVRRGVVTPARVSRPRPSVDEAPRPIQ
jgi:transcriptional regulator with XRE-family HTH domain